MILKYLLILPLLSLTLSSLRFHDEEMLRKHHNHSSQSDDPLTVYLMPHSHDDVGWLKTVDNYFYGDDQKTQWAGVRYTIDSVIVELSQNPTYKFSIVQMAFLYRWWNTANETQKDLLKLHIKNGQLEIINGGWCMHDEATTYYEDIIDQMTTGLTWLKSTLGVVPTIGWHIDPFGHQSSNAAIFSQLGFNAWFFSRIDYQDKEVRLSKKAFEMVWHPFQHSGADNSIFSHLNYFNYQAPPGFCFDKTCKDEPIKNDSTLSEYNLIERSQNLTKYFKSMATHFRSTNLFHTIGEDFHYSNARMWFMNFDKLINHINKNSSYGVTFKYATPSEYISAINRQNIVYPTKTDDFYPYADQIHAYWTGYFTSRVSLKSLVKEFGRYFQTAKNHISFLSIANRSPYISSNRDKVDSAIWEMEMAQGILQHHDAVSGTAKQKVTDDYIMIASRAYSTLHSVYDQIRREVFNREIGEDSTVYKTLWNSTYQEWGITNALNKNQNVMLHLYNPGPSGTRLVKIKVDNTIKALSILRSNGDQIKGDLICSNALNNKDCELIFAVDFQEASYTYIKLKKLSSGGTIKVIDLQTISSMVITKTFTITSTTKVTFTKSDHKMAITLDNHSFDFTLGYNYYQSYQGDDRQKSGAYIFRPSDSTINQSKKYSNFKSYHYAEGDTVTIFTFEGDKTYTKIYFSKIPHEMETKGFQMQTFISGIDVSDNKGKEVVMAIGHSVHNNKTFYTDSNGLEEQKRVTNYRPTWTLSVNEPVSGNYYPINSHISVIDSATKSRLSVLVDRSEGGTACKDGFIELMIHRRTLKDDLRGVDEPLNETEQGGKGLAQKVRHWIVFGEGYRARQKSNDQSIVITWSESGSDGFSKSQIAPASLPVDENIKLFIRPYTNETYLFRAHNFDSTTQKSVRIPDGWKTVETTLAGNLLLSDWKGKQLKWKDQPYTLEDEDILKKMRESRERMVDSDTSISLRPFEIRTFLLSKSQQ